MEEIPTPTNFRLPTTDEEGKKGVTRISANGREPKPTFEWEPVVELVSWLKGEGSELFEIRDLRSEIGRKRGVGNASGDVGRHQQHFSRI